MEFPLSHQQMVVGNNWVSDEDAGNMSEGRVEYLIAQRQQQTEFPGDVVA